jgi:hypothetical protein
MYPQFKVHAEDQQYTRILGHDLRGTLAAYQLVGITFGLAPSVFLATRTLTQILKTSDDFDSAYSLKNCFYVDDYLQSFLTISQRQITVKNIVETLKETGCDSCKISMTESTRKGKAIANMKNNMTSTLGMR